MNSGLSGPFSLTTNSINIAVAKTSPGTYVLGETRTDGVFVIRYVGRSDSDLNSRLQRWVGKYNQFKALYFETKYGAFEKECNLYHGFGGSSLLDNMIHPATPQNTNWSCPVCNGIYRG